MDDMNDVQLRRLDMGLLLVLDEVLRTGNLTRAGERMNLTPSAVSHALARLRDIFGDPLFLRRAQGVVATPRARLLREPVARALASIRAALAQAREFRPDAIDRLFRVVALDAVIVLQAPDVLARLAREAPNARIAFRSMGREESLQALRDNAIDFAIGVFDPPSGAVQRRPFGRESFAVVARENHPRLQSGLSLETWLACDHILVSAAGDLVGAVDAALAARGLERRTRAAMPQFLAAFATIAASDATATVPMALARRYAAVFGLAIHPPPIPLPPFELAIVRAMSEAPDPALDWLVELFAATGPRAAP